MVYTYHNMKGREEQQHSNTILAVHTSACVCQRVDRRRAALCREEPYEQSSSNRAIYSKHPGKRLRYGELTAVLEVPVFIVCGARRGGKWGGGTHKTMFQVLNCWGTSGGEGALSPQPRGNGSPSGAGPGGDGRGGRSRARSFTEKY